MKMPGEILPMMLSTGVGVGVLAGVVSGVCFLVFNGYSWSRRVRQGDKLRAEDKEPRCSVCSSPTCDECVSCSLPLCPLCSTGRRGTVRCQACSDDRFVFTRELKAGNSFLNYLRETANFGYRSDSEGNLNRSRVSGAIGASIAEESDSERQRDDGKQVRDFLQRLAEHLAGGSLDDVAVSRMYQHPEYLPLTAGQSINSNSSRAKLQQLVQRVIEEALKLPAFLDYSGIERDSEGRLPQFSPQTYEDLLATAILNKVIDKYQHEVKRSNGASSSGVHSGSSSPGVSARARRRKHSKRDSSPSPSPDQSSVEPMSQDDYANSDSSGHVSDINKGVDENGFSTDDDTFKKSYNNPVDGALSNMNFKNKSRINFPEYGGDIVEVDDNTNEDKELTMNGNLSGSGNIYANNNSWEENWLFQKKKVKSSQSGPVPMVIPTSSTEYRALIGDRDVEDTTDLSDAGSDNEETPNDIKHVLVNSKTIIGGKNPEILLVDKNDNEINNNDEMSMENYSNLHRLEEDDSVNVEPIVEPEFVQMRRKSPNYTETKRTTQRALSRFLSSNLESDDTDPESSYNQYSSMILGSSIVENHEVQIDPIAEATNLDVVDRKENPGQESSCNHQQDGEYTETVAVPVQRHLDSLKRQHYTTQEYDISNSNENEENEPPPPLPPTPIPRLLARETSEEIILPITLPSTQISSTQAIQPDIDDEPIEEEIVLRNISNTCEPPTISTEKEDTITEPEPEKPEIIEESITRESNDVEISENDIPGSIAEREHKKWLNAVPMVNNPYSPEAIKTRLDKQKRSSVFDLITKSPVEISSMNGKGDEECIRYSRDYYINEAKTSKGARIKPKESAHSDHTPLVKTPSYISRNIDEPEINNNVNVSNTIDNMEEIYVASPAIAEDIDNQFDELYEKATKYDKIEDVHLNERYVEKFLKLTDDDETVDESLSSVDDSYKIYNVETGKIINKIYNKENMANNLSQSKQWRSSGDIGQFDNEEKIKYSSTIELIHEEVPELPSVKELAKNYFNQTKAIESVPPKRRGSRDLLESNTPSIKPVTKQPSHSHSLTARSIPKEFRDGLKESKPTVTNSHPGGSKSVPNGINELVREGQVDPEEDSVPPPGSLKTKLNFFEQLNK